MSLPGNDWIVGCMSGTSADGVDIAAVATDGIAIRKLGKSRFRGYTPDERDTIIQAFGCWPGEAAVPAAENIIERTHELALRGFEPGTPVGFHGQTLAHDPDSGRTHQAGSGDRLAAAINRRVVWDFRSKDMSMGGQGAPLAPFFHFAVATFLRISRPIAILNLGGVANATVIDPAFDLPEEDGALVAFDTGPANAVIDDFVRKRAGLARDDGGSLALAGNADPNVVAQFTEDPWFREPPPKSLDRNVFGYLLEAVDSMTVEDGAATLTACVIAATSRSLALVDRDLDFVAVSGGGRLNRAIMRGLETVLDSRVIPVEEINLDGDMLEAQAFAFLAARVLRGLPTSCPGTTGCSEPVCGGRISG